MNPSDEVDDFLAEAGAQWRAGQPSPPEPDLGRITGGGRRPPRWVPALAAAGVAAIAAGALVVLPGSGDSQVTGPEQTVAQSNDPGALVVRDGDRVEVSGEVIAAPGRPVVFCTPHAEAAIGYLPGKEPARSCPADLQVTVTGVDLARLTGAVTRKGVTSGQAQLVGTWTGRTIAVQEQKAPSAERTGELQNDFLADVPCPAPAGGWRPTDGSPSVSEAVANYVSARPDQLSELWIGWPGGVPGPSATDQGKGPEQAASVLVVQVVQGDLEQVRSELQALYAGNLCVAPGKFSQTAAKELEREMQALGSKGLGISSSSSVLGNRPAAVYLTVVDEKAFAEFSRIGLDKFELHPAVRPVR